MEIYTKRSVPLNGEISPPKKQKTDKTAIFHDFSDFCVWVNHSQESNWKQTVQRLLTEYSKKLDENKSKTYKESKFRVSIYYKRTISNENVFDKAKPILTFVSNKVKGEENFNRLLAIFCVEFVVDAKSSHLKLIDLLKSNAFRINVYFYGLIHPNHRQLVFGSVIDPRTSSSYNCLANEEMIVIYASALTMNPLFCNNDEIFSYDDGTVAPPLENTELTPEQIKNEKLAKRFEKYIPPLFLYFLDMGLPSVYKGDVDYLKEFNIRDAILRRLSVLCGLTNTTGKGKTIKSAEEVMKELPIKTPDSIKRDRICMHYLIRLIAEVDDEHCANWYIQAEQLLLSYQLKFIDATHREYLVYSSNIKYFLGDFAEEKNYEAFMCRVLRLNIEKLMAAVRSDIEKKREISSDYDPNSNHHLLDSMRTFFLDYLNKNANIEADELTELSELSLNSF